MLQTPAPGLSLLLSACLATLFDGASFLLTQTLGGETTAFVMYARFVPYFMASILVFGDGFSSWQVLGTGIMTLAILLYFATGGSGGASAGAGPRHDRDEGASSRKKTALCGRILWVWAGLVLSVSTLFLLHWEGRNNVETETLPLEQAGTMRKRREGEAPHVDPTSERAPGAKSAAGVQSVVGGFGVQQREIRSETRSRGRGRAAGRSSRSKKAEEGSRSSFLEVEEVDQVVEQVILPDGSFA